MTIEQQPHGRKPKKKATAPNVVAGTLHDPAPFFKPGEPTIRFTGEAEPSKRSIQNIRVDDITPSSFNIPHRDPDAEMVASVKQHGVLEAILLRRIPNGALVTRQIDPEAAELFDAKSISHVVHYEIVFGERRWKAAQRAGQTTIPAELRELTDEEALDLQTDENLHRADLSPLQEAAVFALYQRRGTDIPAIAARVHKPERHILQRIKLLELQDAERAALLLGKITLGTALELACLPKDLTPAVRDKALLSVLPSDGSVLATKIARTHITNLAYLRMAAASFPTDDATLVPAAGSCMTCPKRTGAQLALSIEGLDDEDRCGDHTCWTAKTEAIWERKKVEARAAGLRVLDTKSSKKGEADAARTLINRLWNQNLVDLDRPCHVVEDPELAAAEKEHQAALDADDTEAIDASEKKLAAIEVRTPPTWRALLGDAVKPSMVLREDTHGGQKIHELADKREAVLMLNFKGLPLPADVLAELEPDAGAGTAGAEGDGTGGRDARDQELRAGQRLQERAEELFAARVRELLVEHAEKTPPRLGIKTWKALIAGALAHAVDADIEGLFKARGWAGFSELDPDDIATAVLTRADHLSEPKLRSLLVDVLCTLDAARFDMATTLGIATTPLKAKAMKDAKAELDGAQRPCRPGRAGPPRRAHSRAARQAPPRAPRSRAPHPATPAKADSPKSKVGKKKGDAKKAKGEQAADAGAAS